jgi:sporulation protein YlmC with PRC-barrel domain
VITQAQLNALYDAEVVDQAGEKVGPLDTVYLDSLTGDPAWVSVRAGWFGGRRVFCPLGNAEVVGSQIHVPYPVAVIKGAPEILADEQLSEGEEELLYNYYAVDEGPAPSA